MVVVEYPLNGVLPFSPLVVTMGGWVVGCLVAVFHDVSLYAFGDRYTGLIPMAVACTHAAYEAKSYGLNQQALDLFNTRESRVESGFFVSIVPPRTL